MTEDEVNRNQVRVQKRTGCKTRYWCDACIEKAVNEGKEWNG